MACTFGTTTLDFTATSEWSFPPYSYATLIHFVHRYLASEYLVFYLYNKFCGLFDCVYRAYTFHNDRREKNYWNSGRGAILRETYSEKSSSRIKVHVFFTNDS